MDLCWQVISLLLNMLSRLIITFLPRSKHLSISWLQSLSAVILEPPTKMSTTVCTVSQRWWLQRCTSTAERSYLRSEVKGSSPESQAALAQEWLRGVTTRPRSGAAAGRSYFLPEARCGSQKEQPHVQGVVAALAQDGLEELLHV